MDDLQAMLARARSSAESLMTDACVVSRPGESITDPETGVTAPGSTQVWAGKCKVQTAGGIAEETSVGGSQVSLGARVPQWGLYAHFPMSAIGLKPNDVVEITASADPDLIGRRLRLVNPQSEKTHATARRWNVKEVPNAD